MTIVSFGAAMDNLKGWQKMISWLPDRLAEPALEIVPAALLIAYVICALVSGCYCIAITLKALPHVGALIIRVWIWMKRIAGMAKWLTYDETVAEIRRSDYYLYKIEDAAVSPEKSSFPNISSVMGLSQRPPKSKILERNFVRKLIKAFEARSPGAINDDMYNAEELDDWLEALIEHEVDGKLGKIPPV